MTTHHSFLSLYATPEADPHGGNYQEVMLLFDARIAGAFDHEGLFQTSATTGHGLCNAFVGLYPDEGCAAGTTRLLHAPVPYPRILGRPTSYDDQHYAVLDDVAAGTMTTAYWPSDAFSLAQAGGVFNHVDFNTVLAALNADTELNVIPAPADGAGVHAVHVPKHMFVPPKYVPLFMNRRLTPRQLIQEVCGAISVDGLTAELAPLVRWCVYAATGANAEAVASPLLQTRDVVVPVGDHRFLQWRQTWLQNTLTGLNPNAPTGAVEAANRVAGIMGDILTVQRDAQNEARDARVTAREPKSVSSYYKTYLTDKLMLICEVASEDGLPTLWSDIAAANGKRDREAIELSFRTVASTLHQPELAPVVTPTLAKKFTTCRLAGTNLDDLSEGVNPFLMIIQDYTTSTGSSYFKEALAAAADYDDLMLGRGTVDLNDLKFLKSSSKVVLPENYALARAMLQSFRIVIIAMLGGAHSVVISYERFLTSYVNRENFYIGRLQRLDPQLGPARMLRFVQLTFRAWLQGVFDAPDHRSAGLVPKPDFMRALNKLNMGDDSWVPDIPVAYLKKAAAPSPASNEEKVPTPKTSNSERKQLQVQNKECNPIFDQFKDKMANVKFNDVIKKVGSPPNVERGGKEVPMCASYHLRGVCWSNCGRRADHNTHSVEEDTKLLEWCKKAFE